MKKWHIWTSDFTKIEPAFSSTPKTYVRIPVLWETHDISSSRFCSSSSAFVGRSLWHAGLMLWDLSPPYVFSKQIGFTRNKRMPFSKHKRACEQMYDGHSPGAFIWKQCLVLRFPLSWLKNPCNQQMVENCRKLFKFWPAWAPFAGGKTSVVETGPAVKKLYFFLKKPTCFHREFSIHFARTLNAVATASNATKTRR